MSRHNHYTSALALCPYYRHETRQLICCDGIAPGSVTHVAFDGYEGAKQFKYDFCKGNYRGCPYYQIIDEERQWNEQVQEY